MFHTLRTERCFTRRKSGRSSTKEIEVGGNLTWSSEIDTLPSLTTKVIANELASFGHGIESKPVIVVASKIEIANPEKLKKLKAFAKRKKLPFFALSSVTGEGIEDFKYAVGKLIADLRST